MNKYVYVLLNGILLLTACSELQDNTDSVRSESDIHLKSLPILSSVKNSVANEDGFNAVAGIFIKDFPDYTDQVVCSGTLITPHHVLTAAHCVAELSKKYEIITEDEKDSACHWTAGVVSVGAKPQFNYLQVEFGKFPGQGKNRVIRDIKSVIYHSGYAHITEATACLEEGYDGYEVTLNDIAILELDRDVPESIAKPIPLLPPWLGITQDQIDKGLYALFAGYGYNNKGIKGIRDWQDFYLTSYCPMETKGLYCVLNRTVQIQGCHPNAASCAKYGELDYIENTFAVPKGALFYLQHGDGPCTGDSGGPAFVVIGNRRYVAGVTSYGDNACQNYGISFAVQDYYHWIKKMVPEVAQYNVELCDNKLDDDNNGLIDKYDPACRDVPHCGDGVLSETELCEENEFHDGEDRCSEWDLKYESGLVKCNDDCSINYDDCVMKPPLETCGNGELDEGETCDGDRYQIMGEELASNACTEASAFFSDGTLSCNDNCTLDTSHCTVITFGDAVCGNGVTEGDEECDGVFFGYKEKLNCADMDSWFLSGQIRCTDDCKIDWSQCKEGSVCGDHKVTGDEPCEGSLFMANAKTCRDWSTAYEEQGVVSCNANCSVDFSQCVLKPSRAALCGNGVLDETIVEGNRTVPAEECDGELFAKGDDCSAWDSRYISGKVTCTDSCTINYVKCDLNDISDVVDDEYVMPHALSSENKPTEKAPTKTGDYVQFKKGDSNQKEALNYAEDKPTPSDPVAEPEVDRSKPSSEGCHANPYVPDSQGFVWFIVVFGGLMLRRRKVQ